MKVGDSVILTIKSSLECFGPKGTPLIVSRVEGEWISIAGFPQDGSYTYRSVNFELANFSLENE